jgi:hypothetical protein
MGCGGSKPEGLHLDAKAGNTMKEGLYTIVSVSSGLAFEEEFLCSPADTDNQRYEIRQHGDSGEVWTCQQVSSRGFFAMDMGPKEGDILHCRGKDPSDGRTDHDNGRRLHWRFLPASIDGTFFIQSVENDSYLHGKTAAAKNGQVGAVKTLDKSDPGFQWRILRVAGAGGEGGGESIDLATVARTPAAFVLNLSGHHDHPACNGKYKYGGVANGKPQWVKEGGGGEKINWTGNSWDCFWGGYSPEAQVDTPVPPLAGYNTDRGGCDIKVRYQRVTEPEEPGEGSDANPFRIFPTTMGRLGTNRL